MSTLARGQSHGVFNVTTYSLIAAVLVLAPARAAVAWESSKELRYSLEVDLPVTLGAGAVWLGSELLKGSIAPQACRWCSVNGLDNSIRTALLWEHPAEADRLSNVGAYGLVPVAVLALTAFAAVDSRTPETLPADVLIIAEAVAVAGVLNQTFKFAFGRERPFVAGLEGPSKGFTQDPSDNNVSFYSGHTSFAFSLAVASGTVATLQSYRLAPLVWGVGVATATLTGYLRIAADRHYFTDVFIGALAGASVGFTVPYLFHRAASGHGTTPFSLSAFPIEGGAFVSASWRFWEGL